MGKNGNLLLLCQEAERLSMESQSSLSKTGENRLDPVCVSRYDPFAFSTFSMGGQGSIQD